MNLVVIYDPEKEVAALVDADQFLGYGPAVPGAGADALLVEWLDSFGYDLEAIDSDGARNLFAQWVVKEGKNLPGTPPAAADAPPLAAPVPDTPESAAAVSEAQNAGDGPPPPQPADADPTATGGPTPPESSGSTPPEPGGSDAEPTPGDPAPTPTSDPTAASDAPAVPPDASPPAASPTDASDSASSEAAAAAPTVACATCGGSGSITYAGENGPTTVQCGICGGTGQVPATS